MASIYRHGSEWRAQVRRAGVSKSKTFKTKPEAQRWVRDLEAQIDRGERLPVAIRTTLGDVIGEYTKFVDRTATRSKRATLKMLKTEFKEVRLSEVTPALFLDFVTKRERQGAGPATILVDLVYIGVALKHAGALLSSPQIGTHALAALMEARTLLKHSKRIRGSARRDRRPTETELKAIRDQLHAPSPKARYAAAYWDLILFAIGTTLRLGEILSLRWEDFDPKTRTILVRDRKHPTQKQGNHGRIPLLQNRMVVAGEPIDTIAILMRQPSAGKKSGAIFPHNANSVSIHFGRICKKLHIEDLNFHDLRHEAVSRLFELGYQIQEVAVFSGHRSWDQLKRYTNLKPELLHQDNTD